MEQGIRVQEQKNVMKNCSCSQWLKLYLMGFIFYQVGQILPHSTEVLQPVHIVFQNILVRICYVCAPVKNTVSAYTKLLRLVDSLEGTQFR